ncbi:hypothetical protein Tco_0227040 [Tanacetum coccineum]
MCSVPGSTNRESPRTITTLATTTNTTSVTNAHLQEMIDQGVTVALAARDANRSTNGDDSHNSGMGIRRTERVAQECTYQDFMKGEPPLFQRALWELSETTHWFENDGECIPHKMFPEESDKIERYVGGLPNMIHGNIVASRPKTMQDAIEMATELN